jgi:hypothetical protein
MLGKIYLFTSMAFFLSINSGNYNCIMNKRVTVVGKAVNDKGIAVVFTDKGPYFLNKIYRWDEIYLGKIVEVTGILRTKTHEKKSTDTMWVQERVGTIRILKRSKWKLVEQ